MSKATPDRPTPATRVLERTTAGLSIVSPYSGQTESVAHYVADRNQMGLLHMNTADPLRTPTFIVFTTPEIALTVDSATCTGQACVGIDNTEVWVHGNIAPEINGDWLGIVGPGVKKAGIQDGAWSDHTDVRPTMLAVLGLTDDYEHQGRVLSEFLEEPAKAPSARQAAGQLEALGDVYKQLNAPVGEFALATLRATTAVAARGSTADDHVYADAVAALADLGQRRDDVSSRIGRLLDEAWFHGEPARGDDIRALIDQAQKIIERAKNLASP
jgi:hypothetical protein